MLSPMSQSGCEHAKFVIAQNTNLKVVHDFIFVISCFTEEHCQKTEFCDMLGGVTPLDLAFLVAWQTMAIQNLLQQLQQSMQVENWVDIHWLLEHPTTFTLDGNIAA